MRWGPDTDVGSVRAQIRAIYTDVRQHPARGIPCGYRSVKSRPITIPEIHYPHGGENVSHHTKKGKSWKGQTRIIQLFLNVWEECIVVSSGTTFNFAAREWKRGRVPRHSLWRTMCLISHHQKRKSRKGQALIVQLFLNVFRWRHSNH
jgi:hypothetical protein